MLAVGAAIYSSGLFSELCKVILESCQRAGTSQGLNGSYCF